MDSRPTPSEPCLDEPYPSSQKGGTVVVADVTDLAEHVRRIADPDGYRPPSCFGCGYERLWVHDYPRRKPRADPDAEAVEVKIVRYVCVRCEAVWRVLPRFLARCLWRTWRVVEWSTLGCRPADAPPIPARTLARWRSRLRSAGRVLVQRLATSGAKMLEAVAGRVGLDAQRHHVVREHAAMTGSTSTRWLADLAVVVHRLSPGVRVM